jgi:hypothetical protein
MITVRYETKRNGEHVFWVGRHGPHSIRIDANKPGVYRWTITRDRRSIASGVAAIATRPPTMRPPPSRSCHANHRPWGTLGHRPAVPTGQQRIVSADK